ncbi:hypothetical protein D4R89_08020 [bacterium]|nr:MAG: hypothetical protein D4R89_08020 [bacterium]
MKVKVAAIQTKTFLEADEQTRNIETAREYIAGAAQQGAKFICFPETYPGPWNAKPGVLRDWRRPDVYWKNYPNW